MQKYVKFSFILLLLVCFLHDVMLIISGNIPTHHDVTNIIILRRIHAERQVFGFFHLFALAGTFVVDAAEVQNAVDDDAVQLLVVALVELLGVGPYCIQTDE